MVITTGSAHTITLKLKNVISNVMVGDVFDLSATSTTSNVSMEVRWFGTGVARIAPYLLSDNLITMNNAANNVIVGMTIKEL
jgi:hypothetical protein